MIKSIIFDFDGVIHDTLHIGYRINKQLDPDLKIEDYKGRFMGNLYEHKNVTPESSKKFFEIAEKEYALLKIEEEIKNELIRLRNKYWLFIITSGKEAILAAYFKRNNLSGLFDDIMGVETHKSKAEKFRILLQKHGLKTEECAFITDTLGDILEANKAGIKTIAVDYGFHERGILEKGNPHSIVSDFHDIEKEVSKINLK